MPCAPLRTGCRARAVRSSTRAYSKDGARLPSWPPRCERQLRSAKGQTLQSIGQPQTLMPELAGGVPMHGRTRRLTSETSDIPCCGPGTILPTFRRLEHRLRLADLVQGRSSPGCEAGVPADRSRLADAEPLRRLSARGAGLDGGDHPLAKILRQGQPWCSLVIQTPWNHSAGRHTTGSLQMNGSRASNDDARSLCPCLG